MPTEKSLEQARAFLTDPANIKVEKTRGKSGREIVSTLVHAEKLAEEFDKVFKEGQECIDFFEFIENNAQRLHDSGH